MGTEQRRNGNLYYYKKRRVGDRVISEYVGSGAVVQLEEYLAIREKQEKEAQRRKVEAARRLLADIDGEVDSACDLIDLMVKASLLAGGYHSHKGQWRKSRR